MYKKRESALYLASFGLYWMGMSLTMGMAVPYLGSLGFSNTAMGAVLSAANVLSVLVSLTLASLADSYGAKGISALLSSGLAAAAAALGVLLLAPFSKPLFAAAYVLLAASVLALGPLYIKLYFDLSRAGELPAFGIFRAFGSLCFALMSFGAGAALRRLSVGAVPAINAACVLLQLAAVTALRPALRGGAAVREKAEDSGGGGGYLSLLRSDASLALLLCGLFLIFMVHNNVSSFKANILDSLGADASAVAFLNGVTVVSEIPVMALYGRFSQRSPRRLLAVSFAFFLVKIVLITAASSVPMLFAAFALQSLSFGLYSPAVVDYINERFPYAQAGRAQGLVGNIPVAASVIGSLLVGAMLDNQSLRAALGTLCAVTAVGAALALAALRLRKK